MSANIDRCFNPKPNAQPPKNAPHPPTQVQIRKNGAAYWAVPPNIYSVLVLN